MFNKKFIFICLMIVIFFSIACSKKEQPIEIDNNNKNIFLEMDGAEGIFVPFY